MSDEKRKRLAPEVRVLCLEEEKLVKATWKANMHAGSGGHFLPDLRLERVEHILMLLGSFW